jgi:FixJ family two-component response regulator
MTFKVFLIDDDVAIQKAMGRLLRAQGYESRSYASAMEFLADDTAAEPGCVILDLNLPEIDGLQLQRHLTSNGAPRPIIFLSGMDDVQASVRAMKAGAIDFLTKPVQRQALVAAIERAREEDARIRRSHEEREVAEQRLAKLTPREKEVLGHVVAGRLNKQIAATLGTVEKTIKVHRGRMMLKLGMRSVADLVRFTVRAGL